MNKPVLVIMAAGMGSRFGGTGLKQMAAVDDEGQVIIDFSMYDAYLAGFRDVICIIKEEMREDFENIVAKKVRSKLNIHYAYQKMDMLPKGYEIPEGRVKPWGTSHAVLCAKELVNGPFAVINADDFYGRSAYKTIFDYLSKPHGDAEHAIVGYILKNTLSENGTVSRGVCEVDENGRLVDIVERLKIDRRGYTEDGGLTFTPLDENTVVSMNFFGFQKSFMDELEKRFPDFLDEGLKADPKKCEYLLPRTVDKLIKEGCASVQTLLSSDSWYGITYSEDLPAVKVKIKEMKDAGKYPKRLWD
ncbi:MAG: sugar phosphate nucleotidyltransferase [Clostridia bacterium]|nr:sugar phosphate nucleotidyltransferase [Clostridia bacterium]